MTAKWLALDVGGANLKAANGRGFAISVPFPLWSQRRELPDALRKLVDASPPAERLAVLYVAFCPPLERVPSVSCEIAAGPLCDVKVAQIFHQGARIEARLLRASTDAAQVKISFLASERPLNAT